MAYPQIVSTAATNNGAATSVPLTMPATITAANLLLAYIGSVLAVTGMSGWTPVGSTSSGGTFNLSVYAKIAAGGDTATPTFSGAQGVCAEVYNISGWSGTLTDLALSAISGSVDPPALTPALGSQDYLWIPACGGEGASVTAAPTNYGGLITASATSSSVVLGCANRQLTAATENPGAFSYGGLATAAVTVAVPPVRTATVQPAVVSQAVMRAATR